MSVSDCRLPPGRGCGKCDYCRTNSQGLNAEVQGNEPRPDKAPCPTCGTLDAVDLADGWTKRVDDLYTEWCRGHQAGRADAIEQARREERERIAAALREHDGSKPLGGGWVSEFAHNTVADWIEGGES